jgi:hypothetical protein
MSKAKDDINRYLNEADFQSIDVQKFKNKFEKLFQTTHTIHQKFGMLKRDDVLLMQFPTYLGRRFECKLVADLKQRGVKLIALIHDLDALRFSDQDGVNRPTLAMDVEDLNTYDVVISSNAKMTALLQKHGLKRPVVNLEIFDYYYPQASTALPQFETILNFAGNLNKSEFLYDFPETVQTKLRLFGMYDKSRELPKQSEYCGIFTPEDLVSHLDRGFGLVWDGLSSQTIKGLFGEYLKYNNPHKTSLYLAAGLPVVIWKGAALSEFIAKNQVGVCVESLNEIDLALQQVSANDYQKMAENAQQLSQKITSGYFVKRAVEQAIKQI